MATLLPKACHSACHPNRTLWTARTEQQFPPQGYSSPGRANAAFPPSAGCSASAFGHCLVTVTTTPGRQFRFRADLPLTPTKHRRPGERSPNTRADSSGCRIGFGRQQLGCAPNIQCPSFLIRRYRPGEYAFDQTGPAHRTMARCPSSLSRRNVRSLDSASSRLRRYECELCQ